MNKDECGLEKECMEFLCEFPDRVPYRCRLCTPLVRFVLVRIRDSNKEAQREIDRWHNGCYDE